MSEKKQKMTSEGLAIIYAAVLDIWDGECDRFWARNNIFLIVNSVLFATITYFAKFSIVSLFITLVGVYVSGIWILINKKGAYYVHRWRPVIEKLEGVMQSEFDLSVRPLHEVRPDHKLFCQKRCSYQWLLLLWNRELPRSTTTELMRYVTIGFFITWILLFIYAVLHNILGGMV